MFDFRLWDGAGKKKSAGVTDDQEVCVIPTSYPPLTRQKVQPFRQYLTDDGTAAGSNDMAVDGSSTNVDFYVPASPTDDRYITSLNFLVAYGASGKPYLWADGAELTNGTRLFYDHHHSEIDIHDGIKTNQDLFRLSFSPIPVGWEIRHVNDLNDYGYFISMDLTRMGLPFGIKLDAGSNQKLTCTVRDNAGTDADTFNVICYGFDRFK
jgi:hypothetical protein